MARARLVLREKVIDEEGNIVELVIWEVPSTPENPAGCGIGWRSSARGSGPQRSCTTTITLKGTIATLRGSLSPTPL